MAVTDETMAYYHLLAQAAVDAVTAGDLLGAVLIRRAADDVADDMAAELVRSLP